ncbi:MAG TPA: DUF2167 domain-containing protein [Alphaproteobacteria bacterium]|nr:DUF2167 domain-containing protein [Alphaproteobacteria bacterium]
MKTYQLRIVRKAALAFFAIIMAFGLRAGAQQDDSAAAAEKILQSLQYKHGDINIQDGLATLNVPANFKYLDAADARKVLVQLWNNPPEQADDVMGMLMPADVGPLDSNCWVVTISYDNDGHVPDDDASKINYDDLLKQMQQAVRDHNKERTDKGYPAIELVGWAAPPRYDAPTHKLYWAKEIKFEGEPENTLNYEIRILGRRGVLDLEAVADMRQLPEIEQQTPDILNMVDFDQGNRYADFDPKVDKVAKYGIAALVAGGVAGVAAKLGLFKLIWVFILACKKFIILGIAAIAAFFKKIFKGRSNTPTT